MNGHAEDYLMLDAIRDVGRLPRDQIGAVYFAIYTLTPACPVCEPNFNGNLWLARLYSASGGRPTYLYDWSGDPPRLAYSGIKI
jgi:hypothetical protein